MTTPITVNAIINLKRGREVRKGLERRLRKKFRRAKTMWFTGLIVRDGEVSAQVGHG